MGGGAKPFDLVESLEVAEHLEEKYAKNFIELLTKFSDIILFSAAIPYQGGTNHFNEQPPQYWAEIFKNFDFLCFDILRTENWDNEKIGFWYRQNTMFYVHKSKAYIFENLGYKSSEPLYLVIPTLFNNRVKMAQTLQIRFTTSQKEIQTLQKARIQNHLSYKLGSILTRNSKSLFGLLKIPFLLIAVTLAHKEQEKAYKEKIKANPSLALPPLESYLDYQEALKEKECFTYKLGEAFIKACKSWYRGGFIKFFFEAKSLYKEFKSKKAKQE